MRAIAAVDQNWGIGYRGELLTRIPDDLKRFKELTTGKVVVYGRKTLETFPQGKPLPNRTNIVLTSNSECKVDGAIIVHDIKELTETLKAYNDDDIYVIGGESVYRQLLPWCEIAHITRIERSFDADAYFSDLDASNEKRSWEIVASSGIMNHNEIQYRFIDYRRK